MKKISYAGRLFIKSLLISLSVVLPLCLIAYFTYLGRESDKPAGITADNIPIIASSGNLLVAVCSDSGDQLFFGAGIRFDTEENRIAFTIFPASALPEPTGSIIVRGGTPSSYMEGCSTAVTQKYRADFQHYVAIKASDLGRLISAIGSFRYNVTVPISAVGQNGLTEFRLDCGDTIVNGDTAAAIIKYSRALPEKDYISVISSLSESALSRFLETGFSENAINSYYTTSDRISSNIGSYFINRLYHAALLLERQDAAVHYSPLEGEYSENGFVSSSILTDSFS